MLCINFSKEFAAFLQSLHWNKIEWLWILPWRDNACISYGSCFTDQYLTRSNLGEEGLILSYNLWECLLGKDSWKEQKATKPSSPSHETTKPSSPSQCASLSREALPLGVFTVFRNSVPSSGPSDQVHDPVVGTFHFQTTIFELTFTKNNHIDCKIVWAWKARNDKELKSEMMVRDGRKKKVVLGSYKKIFNFIMNVGDRLQKVLSRDVTTIWKNNFGNIMLEKIHKRDTVMTLLWLWIYNKNINLRLWLKS